MANQKRELNINQFNQDIEDLGGYVYTSNNKLSSQLANERLSRAIADLIDLEGKTVIDIGCGDGAFTAELLNANPRSVVGIDAAEKAISIAIKRYSEFNNLSFKQINIYDLKQLKETPFDVAVIRGVLHHLYDVENAIYHITRVAKEIVVTEHNGLNPVRRIIEKVSKYQIEHEEKSYWPWKLNSWFKRNGGKLVDYSYCGMVPFFCPDIIAKFLNSIEPLVEKLPIIKQLSCGAYVFKVVIK